MDVLNEKRCKKDMELIELFNKMTELFMKCKIKVEPPTVIYTRHKSSKNIVLRNYINTTLYIIL